MTSKLVSSRRNFAFAEKVRPGKTLLPSNPTFKAEKSDFVRPTIVVTTDTSKLSPIASEESSVPSILLSSTCENLFVSLRRENDENERAAPSRRRKTKSPQIVETNAKRRTTRRTTIRLLQENNAPPAAPERPSKTRYATRYSTRLASAMVTEEMSIATTRRTTRLSSE